MRRILLVGALGAICFIFIPGLAEAQRAGQALDAGGSVATCRYDSGASGPALRDSQGKWTCPGQDVSYIREVRGPVITYRDAGGKAFGQAVLDQSAGKP